MAEPAKKLPAEEKQNFSPAQQGKNPAGEIIDFNQYKRNLRKNQQVDRQTLPKQHIAEKYKQGAPMEGVSQSAGLTGGVENKETGQKPPAQRTSEIGRAHILTP